MFDGLTQRGQTSVNWFFEFKRPLVINHEGDTLAFDVTDGNLRDMSMLDQLDEGLWGKLFGD